MLRSGPALCALVCLLAIAACGTETDPDAVFLRLRDVRTRVVRIPPDGPLPSFWRPEFDNGRILVTDFRSHQLVVIDDNDDVHVVGRLGEGPGEFSLPLGVAVGDGGDIFVSDRVQQRLHVFSADLQIDRAIPTGLTPDGIDYWRNDRVVAFGHSECRSSLPEEVATCALALIDAQSTRVERFGVVDYPIESFSWTASVFGDLVAVANTEFPQVDICELPSGNRTATFATRSQSFTRWIREPDDPLGRDASYTTVAALFMDRDRVFVQRRWRNRPPVEPGPYLLDVYSHSGILLMEAYPTEDHLVGIDEAGLLIFASDSVDDSGVFTFVHRAVGLRGAAEP